MTPTKTLCGESLRSPAAPAEADDIAVPAQYVIYCQSVCVRVHVCARDCTKDRNSHSKTTNLGWRARRTDSDSFVREERVYCVHISHELSISEGEVRHVSPSFCCRHELNQCCIRDEQDKKIITGITGASSNGSHNNNTIDFNYVENFQGQLTSCEKTKC